MKGDEEIKYPKNMFKEHFWYYFMGFAVFCIRVENFVENNLKRINKIKRNFQTI